MSSASESQVVAAPVAVAPAPADVSCGSSSGTGTGTGGERDAIDSAQLKTVPLQPDPSPSPKLTLQLPSPPLLPASSHAACDPPSQTQQLPAASGSALSSVASTPAPSAPGTPTPERATELVSVRVEMPAEPTPQPLDAAPPPPAYSQDGSKPGYDPKYNGGTYGHSRPQYVVVAPSYVEDDATCAQCGCAFAVCFPIVGCITYCCNADAPYGTQRRKWARLALSTALIAFLLGILLVWFTAEPDKQ